MLELGQLWVLSTHRHIQKPVSLFNDAFFFSFFTVKCFLTIKNILVVLGSQICPTILTATSIYWAVWLW